MNSFIPIAKTYNKGCMGTNGLKYVDGKTVNKNTCDVAHF